MSLDKLAAVGCDRANVNTGRLGGTVRLIKEKLQKPVQWLIYQLHENKISLCHLLTHLDGSTSGPHAFSFVIGKELMTCEKLPISFSPIEGDLPEMANPIPGFSTIKATYMISVTQ